MQVSIIIPYYRAKTFFLETLQSIYKQTGIDKEVIVVNDGSGIEDELFLTEQQQQFGFKLIHQTNQGVSAARNAGAKVASGNFLLFLDADDCLANDALLHLLKEDKNVIVGNYEVNNQLVTPNLTPAQFIQGNAIQVGSVLINKNCFNKIGGFNEQLAYSEDMDFWFRLRNSGVQFYYINKNVLHYRVHSNSVMQQQSIRLYYDNVKSFKYRIQHSKKIYHTEPGFKQLVSNRLTTMHWYARAYGIKIILKNYLLALQYGVLIRLVWKMLPSDWRYFFRKNV